MQFEQIQALMQPGDKACRVTWDADHYLQCDPDGVIRGKNKRFPEDLGSIWAERTGYDTNADDFILLTNLDFAGVKRGLQRYCGTFLLPDNHRTLVYLQTKDTQRDPGGVKWEIRVTGDHWLNVHYYPAYDGALPVTGIDIARLKTDQHNRR